MSDHGGVWTSTKHFPEQGRTQGGTLCPSPAPVSPEQLAQGCGTAAPAPGECQGSRSLPALPGQAQLSEPCSCGSQQPPGLGCCGDPTPGSVQSPAPPTGRGDLHTRSTRNTALEPPSSQGFKLGAAKGACSGLLPCCSITNTLHLDYPWIIPFPLPRQELHPPGEEQSSADVLRAGWGHWNCSTSQTLSPKRLKKYL